MINIREDLFEKLEKFIKKYYKNLMIKGVIYTLSLVLLFFIIVNLLEYIFQMKSITRTIIFYTFLITSLIIITYFIFIPLLKLWKISNRLSNKQASEIIGRHFINNIDDKLVNTLELIEQEKTVNSDLLSKSIDQKIKKLDKYTFTNAINLGENKKYIKYAIIPILLLLMIYIVNKNIISDSSYRLINHNKEFIPKAPFEFVIKKYKIDIIEDENLELEVIIKGKVIPNEVFAEIDNNKIKLIKKDNDIFMLNINNLKKSFSFNINALDYYSKPLIVNVLKKAEIDHITAYIQYPAYTKQNNKLVENLNNITVPQGTIITWKINTHNTSNIDIIENSNQSQSIKNINDYYEFTRNIKDDYRVKMIFGNQYGQNKDTSFVNVNVQKDNYPEINVTEKTDDIDSNFRYFRGEIKDDYGFQSLKFVYRINKNKNYISKLININKNFTTETFIYTFDLENDIQLNLGDEVEYYFQVSDNDANNGYKTTNSQIYNFRLPTEEEFEQKIENENKDIKNDLNKKIDEIENIQNNIDKIKTDIYEKNKVDWNNQTKLMKLIEQQKELEKKLKELASKKEEMNRNEEKYKDNSDELKKEQEKIQDMIKELESDEMKKLYEDLEKMMKNMDKNKIQNSLEKLNMENLNLKKELERTLEMFKQLEIDKKLEEFAKELEKLAEEQEELSKKNEKNTSEEQEKLNKEYEKIEEKLNDLNQKNENLKNPKELFDINQKEDAIKQDMKDSQQSLEQKNQKKAVPKQKSASDNMKKMAESAKKQMTQNNQEQNEENIEDLQQILENLVTLSFDQEDALTKLQTTNANTEKYIEIGRSQKKIQSDSKIIEDSLYALSLRAPQIQAFVNKEMTLIKQHINEAINKFGDRITNEILVNQQSSMTSINNLAIMLDESLKKMQEDLANQMKKSGDGSCNNPGGSNPKPGLIPSMNDIKSQMQEMMDKMGNQIKEGKSGQSNSEELSKQMSQMAKDQEKLSEMIKNIKQEIDQKNDKQDGNKLGNDLNEMKKIIEESQNDILKKNMNQKTYEKMREAQEIFLRSEEAIRKISEYKEERKSETPKSFKKSNPNDYLDYNKRKEAQIEMLKTIPPELMPYYKKKVNDYFSNYR